MQITPLQDQHLPEAASLFVQNFKRLRQAVPALPDSMADPGRVAVMLEARTQSGYGVAALDGDRLAGYLSWIYIDNLRGTGKKAAYCPEWCHAAVDEAKPAVYRALYRAASEQWAQAGCGMHALTLLANDHEAEKVWFWNGFGLTVVDAVRPLVPLGAPCPPGFSLRKASAEELDLLSALEGEHWQHYAEPPIFMNAAPPEPADIARFLAAPQNAYWLALSGDRPAGFLRFEKSPSGASRIVASDRSIAITGAYLRPEYRGKSIAPALLDAALREYAGQGLESCSLNFETFNPEAAVFWPRYFQLVCLSMIRVPER
jgi:GNAT superfamily N-acetyltransferase